MHDKLKEAYITRRHLANNNGLSEYWVLKVQNETVHYSAPYCQPWQHMELQARRKVPLIQTLSNKVTANYENAETTCLQITTKKTQTSL